MEISLGWNVSDIRMNAMETIRSTYMKPDLDTAVLAKLEEMHRFDVQLYAFAVELFEAQLEYYGIPNTKVDGGASLVSQPTTPFPSCDNAAQWPNFASPEA